MNKTGLCFFEPEQIEWCQCIYYVKPPKASCGGHPGTWKAKARGSWVQGSKRSDGGGKMLVKSAALVEDLGLAPCTHVMTCNSFISPVPGDLITLSDLWGHQEHTWCAYIHAGKTFRHIKWILIKVLKTCLSWPWWCTYLIPALERQIQVKLWVLG